MLLLACAFLGIQIADFISLRREYRRLSHGGTSVDSGFAEPTGLLSTSAGFIYDIQGLDTTLRIATFNGTAQATMLSMFLPEQDWTSRLSITRDSYIVDRDGHQIGYLSSAGTLWLVGGCRKGLPR